MEAATVPPTQPPPEQPTEEALLTALTVLLLSGQALQVITPQAIPLFGALGIAQDAAQLALSLAFMSPVEYPYSGRAQAFIRRTSYPRRAAYIVSAARRFDAGGTLDRERQYHEAHIGAERARVESATKVDRAAAAFGPRLGWKAKQDSVTTPECRAAHGKNFMASVPPLVGDGRHFPGALHGGACRCVPVPPYPRGTLLP